MKIFDILTKNFLEFNSPNEFGDFFKIKAPYKFFKNGFSCLNRFVKEKDIKKIFILEDVISKQQFYCVNAMSMELYLNYKLNKNELAQISNLKNEKVFSIKIDELKLIKLNTNIEDVKFKNKKTREIYKSSIKEKNKKWRLNNKEYNKERLKLWKLKNKEKIKSYNKLYTKSRRLVDEDFKLRQNLRNRIRIALKNVSKFSTSEFLIGCSIEDLKLYLESKFKRGMTWENYGEWHIDHIIPCSSFDLTIIENQIKCFHYTNLQPLWAEENIKKGTNLQ